VQAWRGSYQNPLHAKAFFHFSDLEYVPPDEFEANYLKC